MLAYYRLIKFKNRSEEYHLKNGKLPYEYDFNSQFHDKKLCVVLWLLVLEEK